MRLLALARQFRIPFLNIVATSRFMHQSQKHFTEINNNFGHSKKLKMSSVAESLSSLFQKNGKYLDLNSDEKSNTGERITITTYNILAQYLIDANKCLYKHVKSDINWPTRLRNIKIDLAKLKSDVFCLQEVQSDHFHTDLKPFLEAQGYQVIYAKKTQEKDDGCAIAFKISRFKLVDHQIVYFHQPNSKNTAAAASANTPDQHCMHFTNNVGLIALLGFQQQTADDLKLIFSTTHLFFSPNRGDTKLGEVVHLLAEIDQFMKKHDLEDNVPVILCGDLNSEPDSLLVKFITQGQLDFRQGVKVSDISNQNLTSFKTAPSNRLLEAKFMPPPLVNRCDHNESGGHAVSDMCTFQGEAGSGLLAHRFKFRPAITYWLAERESQNDNLRKYRLKQTDQDERKTGRLVTSFTSADTCAVDHVFFANPDKSGSIQVQPTWHRALPTPGDLHALGGLPNQNYGSDHVPLTVEFLVTIPNDAEEKA